MALPGFCNIELAAQSFYFPFQISIYNFKEFQLQKSIFLILEESDLLKHIEDNSLQPTISLYYIDYIINLYTIIISDIIYCIGYI